jgi:hypothetical protein
MKILQNPHDYNQYMVYPDNDDSPFYDDNIVAEFQVVHNVSEGRTEVLWLFGEDNLDLNTLSEANSMEYCEV